MLRKKIETGINKQERLSKTIIKIPGEIEYRLYKSGNKSGNKEDWCGIDIRCQKEGIFTPRDGEEFSESMQKLGNSVMNKVRREYRKDKQ